MACVIVPVTEAIISTVATKIIEKKELENCSDTNSIEKVRIPFSRKLKWLSNMLYGGSALLLFEHVWHGEIVPFFPFVTAMNNPADVLEMVRELSTVGVCMAGIITLVWTGMLAIAHHYENQNNESDTVNSEA